MKLLIYSNNSTTVYINFDLEIPRTRELLNEQLSMRKRLIFFLHLYKFTVS